jgi:hypothetical protein
MQVQVSLQCQGQHAYRNHRDEIAAITVKPFEQTLLADVEMLCIKETVFGVRDGGPLRTITILCTTLSNVYNLDKYCTVLFECSILEIMEITEYTFTTLYKLGFCFFPVLLDIARIAQDCILS